MKQYRLPLLDGREIEFKSISAENADRYYQSVISKQSTPEMEQFIFNSITDGKYVDQLDELDAGIILTVIYVAFSYSGFLTDIRDIPRLIDGARKNIDNNVYNILYTTIIKGMPSYTPDTLKTKSLNELLDLFAISEAVLGKQTVDTTKIRELLGLPKADKKKASGTYKDREGKGAGLINKEELGSLNKTLNILEEADFDEFGHYIGNGSLL